MTAMPIDPQMKPRGGMFGGGGDWTQALAAALSAMSAARGNPIGMAGIQMLHQRLGQKREDEQYQQRRQDGLVDYEAKQKIDAQYGQPAQPTEFERMVAASGIQPGTPEYAETMKKMVGVRMNPVVMTPYGPMPYSTVMGGQQGAGLPPVLSDKDFETQGGPAAPPPATFPGY